MNPMTLDEAMRIASIGGRDGVDREALKVLKDEVVRLTMRLDAIRDQQTAGCDGSCGDFGCPSYLSKLTSTPK